MNVNNSNVERIKNVLAGDIPDRVPYFELEISKRHVSYVLGEKVDVISTGLPVDDYIEFTKMIGCDFFYYNFLWKIGRVYRKDSDGKEHYVGGSFKSRDDFSRIKAPDLTFALHRIEELVSAGKKHNLGLILGNSTPYKLAKAAVGYEDFLTKTADDLEFLIELSKRLGEHASQALESFLQFPITAFLVPGDLCYATGPMINPALIRKMWLEQTKEFIKPVKEKGIPVILHMDGDFSNIIDIMLEIEPNAIHPFEVCGNLDICKAKKKYGNKVTLIGNIDISGVLLSGTPEEVRDSVKEHIENLAERGRYMCGSSHEISENIPVENFYALIESVYEFGKY